MELPADQALRWIIAGYARLLAAHGDALGGSVLVQPTGEFFPDDFRADVPSVGRLLRRMATYAPVAADLPIELVVLAAEGEEAGCGSAACGSSESGRARVGRVEEWGDGYRVVLGGADMGHPDLLAASLARGIGAVVLREAGEEDASGAAAEIAAVACGFGTLLVNGAAVWAKACGGLRVARATTLPVEELAVALALFVAVQSLPEASSFAHLGLTQREAVDRAAAWTASNRGLIEILRDRPALLEGGVFDIEPARGPVGRWLARLYQRRPARELRAAATAPPRELTEGQRRRLEEARALVDEVLGSD